MLPRPAWASLNRATVALLSVVTLTLLFTLLFPYHLPFTFGAGGRRSGDTWRASSWPTKSDYDLVVSWYNEDVDILLDTVAEVEKRLPKFARHRTIIYGKNLTDPSAAPAKMRDRVHEIVALPNIGREGETYMSHIIRHYDSADPDLAKHTIFLQPHLAWPWVLLARLDHQLKPNVGFMSLGPYVNITCGMDSSGNSFPRMADVYSAFRQDLCPPVSQLATWAGQFVVSRERILQNPLSAYVHMWEIFNAPPGHWIWDEGWGNNEPTNPTFGHVIERMWPVIFNCTDGRIAETCGEGDGPDCVCWDH